MLPGSHPFECMKRWVGNAGAATTKKGALWMLPSPLQIGATDPEKLVGGVLPTTLLTAHCLSACLTNCTLPLYLLHLVTISSLTAHGFPACLTKCKLPHDLPQLLITTSLTSHCLTYSPPPHVLGDISLTTHCSTY